jgi:hypothetical protein
MAIKKYKDGEKSKGICYTCNRVVDTTVRSADFIEKGKTYHNIQQAFCDHCNEPIAITHGGAVELNRQRK